MDVGYLVAVVLQIRHHPPPEEVAVVVRHGVHINVVKEMAVVDFVEVGILGNLEDHNFR